jgi:PPM family protein phosphatase
VVICPNCHAENRSGAKYCKSCATRLPVSSAVTRPLGYDPSIAEMNTPLPTSASTFPPAGSAEGSGDASNSQTTRRVAPSPRTGTRPLQPADPFERRPVGAIFGDTFIQESIIFSDEHQHRYSVHQLNVPEDLHIHVCSNPDCGAVFPPRSAAPEKFCTDCGKPLHRGGSNLVLIEARSPIPDNIVRMAAKGLSHGSVRAPLAAFVERLGGQPRHCVVVNRISPMENPADPAQAIRWGIRLARGLDYLHDNGVTFDGQIDSSWLGMVNERPVWANFTGCRHHAEGYVTDRLPDTRGLARLIFYWLTGKSTYEHDPNLPPSVQQVFDSILEKKTLTSGLDLADALEQVVDEMASIQTVGYEVGRSSHVGRVRTLNEDSLVCLEMDRIQQSISQPAGVFVVADGMGGHTAGEIASGTIVNVIGRRALQDWFPGFISGNPGVDGPRWLRQAVEAANYEVYALRKSAGSDMGSTLVAVAMEGNKVYIAHVGDSRAYRINASTIQRLTVDHSLVERLVATHQITRDEARHHPQRNVIYRTIGDKATLEVDITIQMLSVGDYLLLCSDGLVGPVDDDTIARIVRKAASPQAACDELIRAANEGGGEDNITVVIVRIIQP